MYHGSATIDSQNWGAFLLWTMASNRGRRGRFSVPARPSILHYHVLLRDPTRLLNVVDRPFFGKLFSTAAPNGLTEFTNY